MSSPHAPEVGRPLQPSETPSLAVFVDGISHQSSARPFTASDGRGELLTILVHFGRRLDALVLAEADTELGGTAAPIPDGRRLATYVVATVGPFAASPEFVQCHRGDGGSASHSESRVLYEQSFSPYAATRVVEGSASPAWNELLAVPLPPGWRDTSSATQQPEQGRLALKLELIERGASHQEDFLLGTCVVPLTNFGCYHRQKRVALAFQAASVNGESDPTRESCACIFASLYASSRSSASCGAALEHVETIVESFTPVVSTGSEDEGLPPDCTSLAALVRLQSEAAPVSNDSISEQKALEDHFELLRDGQALPASSTIASRSTDELCGLTPSSSTATGSASGVYEWLFPLGFTWDAGAITAVEITLLSTSSVPHKPVGRGRLNLSIATAQHLNKDGTPLRHTVIPITLEGDNSRTLGHVALRLRWWDAPAWGAFVLRIPARRVVCTNRWKRSPRPALAWMGALFRGLNRHPVASFCDAGGISSVLAELLAESPSPNDQLQQQEVQQHQQHQQRQGSGQDHGNGEAAAVTALLREQVTHLQTQGDSQRQQIERLQNELDTRLAAIKTCGLELVALRREARQKDEQLRNLEEQLQTTQHREQQQLAELLAPANSNGSYTVVRPENQAASQRFTLLLSKYKELGRELEATKQQLASAQQSLTGYDELETRHAELQEAHLVQASLVQRLQRDKQHAAALKKAVRMQEKVIRQFEQTVAQQSVAASNLQQPPTDDEDSGAETHEALLRVRVQVLEQQLQTNARDAAAELSALRMRVFELELDGSRSPRR